MSCFMCGAGIHDEDAYIKKMKGMGMQVEGDGFGKKLKKVGRKAKKVSKQVGRKARPIAGVAIEEGIPEAADMLVEGGVTAYTGNPIAGKVAGKTTSTALRKAKVGEMARKKSGVDGKKKRGKGMHDDDTDSEEDKPKTKGSGMRRSSAWIEHVKSVASKKKIPYGEALKIASKTYKKN